MFAGWMGLDSTAHFDAGDVRKVDVEEDDLGMMQEGKRDGIVAGPCVNDVITAGTQYFTAQFAIVLVIVDVQHPGRQAVGQSSRGLSAQPQQNVTVPLRRLRSVLPLGAGQGCAEWQTPTARSGRSLINASAPHEMRRRISGSVLTVQIFTGRPERCACCTNRGLTMWVSP